LLGSLAPAAVAASVVACGSSAKTGFGPVDGGAGHDGSHDGTLVRDGQMTRDVIYASDPMVLPHKDAPVSSCTGTHCSSDLRSMVDCNGNVVMTCPPTEGCYGTTCVPACQAAEDNKTNIGCEYYAVTPDTITGVAGEGGAAGACYAAFIANTWDTPVTITADFGGMPLDVSQFAYIPTGTSGTITYNPLGSAQLPAGEIAILFLNRQAKGGSKAPPKLTYDCPAGVTPAITASDTAIHGTGIGSAFHITTDAPVVAYDMYPYGGGRTAVPSATLLLPTSAWDKNYVAVDAYRANELALGSQPWVDFVAMSDGTTITINPTADINAANGVAAATAGVSATYTLNKGQVLELATGKKINTMLPGELTGSWVQSSAPIGVWGGISGLNVSTTNCCTDSGHQQIPPVHALGSEYVAVRYRDRYPGTVESPPWRLVGAVDGTTLTYDPAPPAGAPTTIDLGQVVEFDASDPFVVSSQDDTHPFYMAGYMTGSGMYDPGEHDAGDGTPADTDGRGDPEFVNVIPPDEFLQSYIFFTDPTYPETELVVVRVAGENGFADVALDCAGDLPTSTSTPTTWVPIGTSGKYEYTRFDVVTGDWVGNGMCDNGRHQIKSTGSFGVTVWGWGSPATGSEISGIYTQFASYAYPAGASVAPINSVVVPPMPK